MKDLLRYLLLFSISLLFQTCIEENPKPEITPFAYNGPADEGASPGRLLSLDLQIKQGNYGNIRSLVIIKNEKVIFENYYNGSKRGDLEEIGSATRSIVSTLFGAMLSNDATISTESKLIDLLPDYNEFFVSAPQKDQISIGNLLLNTSGLWWDELGKPWGTENNDAWVMSLSNSWVENILSRPMIREPGFEFNYNSGDAILMAPVISALSGENVEVVANDLLFEPLSIEEWKWDKTPGNFSNTAWGLHLRPIDLAKIGYLFINEGDFFGTQVLTEDWVLKSKTSQNRVSYLFNFSYQWWQFSWNSDVVGRLRNNDVLFAWGEGGQFLFIFPTLKTVVVTTAGNYLNDETVAFIMLKDFIIPALLGLD